MLSDGENAARMAISSITNPAGARTTHTSPTMNSQGPTRSARVTTPAPPSSTPSSTPGRSGSGSGNNVTPAKRAAPGGVSRSGPLRAIQRMNLNLVDGDMPATAPPPSPAAPPASSARRQSQTPIPPATPTRPVTPTMSSAPFASRSFGGAEGTDQWLTDRIVTVAIGPELKKWAVHEKLLSSKSVYFDRVFNGDEDTEPSDELHLPLEEPKLFGLLIRWLYGTAFATSGGTRIFRFAPPDEKETTVRDYLGLYMLGAKLSIAGVRNAAIDALYAHFAEPLEAHSELAPRCPDLADVKYVFDNTDENCQLRRLLIAHTLFFLFNKKRTVPASGSGGSAFPAEWDDEVLRSSGDIGLALIRMLAEWRWVMGRNVPEMKIKPRQEFHDKIPMTPPPPQVGVKSEVTDE
ncbi:hypothetical protein B0T19DRAFT_466468 [Cercophora scortea]|uniref:BTB domain-containing protein n=1 Tax=Cercophora scortea TaxID=314031 RepID=A0AAE0I9T4_9PEZI|nr:hypothetical protein B0T19DRAFT_466468 [Cercophora scortea]